MNTKDCTFEFKVKFIFCTIFVRIFDIKRVNNQLDPFHSNESNCFIKNKTCNEKFLFIKRPLRPKILFKINVSLVTYYHLFVLRKLKNFPGEFQLGTVKNSNLIEKNYIYDLGFLTSVTSVSGKFFSLSKTPLIIMKG